MVCGVGCKSDPVGGDNSVGQSLDTTLIAFGHHDPIFRRRIYHKLKQAAEVTLTAIMDHEKTMTPKERGSRFAQTDLIGIDFILYDGNKDGGGGFPDLRPVVIEVNSMCCTTNCDLYEWMYRESHGEAFQPFVETMVACSQRNLLRDKSFLLLQGEGSQPDRKMTNGVGSGSAAMLNGTESRDESWAIIQQMALEYEIKVRTSLSICLFRLQVAYVSCHVCHVICIMSCVSYHVYHIMRIVSYVSCHVM